MVRARYPTMIMVKCVTDDVLKVTWRRVEAKGHLLIRVHAVLCDDPTIPLACLIYGDVVEGGLHIDG